MNTLRILLLVLFLIRHSNPVFADPTPFTFYAMGDVPYASTEYELLERQLKEIPQEAPFLIHLGDIKRGAVSCEEPIYLRVSNLLKTSHTPVFIIPGDNEWNDCTDPDAAWKLWAAHLHKLDEHWKHDFKVSRQDVRPENFAFSTNGVLFIGINLVGGLVHDKAEWKLRHQQNLTWINEQFQQHGESIHSVVLFGHAAPKFDHSDFFLPLVNSAQELNKPLLYLQGDGHTWVYDQPFTVKTVYRVQVDQGGNAPPVKVLVTGDPKEPFVFDRRK